MLVFLITKENQNMNHLKSSILAATLAMVTLTSANAQIVISGYLANPAGTDSPNEYIQLVATQNIDFSINNYSIVLANNGTAASNGWVAGSTLTYGFDLTSGSVQRGETFYVGGSGQLLNGAGSANLSSLKWIRTINTGNTVGDGFGSSNTSGVFGNGGSNADGFGIFSGKTSTLLATSKPIDALFFGTAVGTAKPTSGGYVMPTNDRYVDGIFGDSNNTYLFSDPGSGAYTKLTGEFNDITGLWTTARTSSLVTLTTTSPVSDIASAITIVPEPSSAALLGFGTLALFGLRRLNRKS